MFCLSVCLIPLLLLFYWWEQSILLDCMQIMIVTIEPSPMYSYICRGLPMSQTSMALVCYPHANTLSKMDNSNWFRQSNHPSVDSRVPLVLSWPSLTTLKSLILLLLLSPPSLPTTDPIHFPRFVSHAHILHPSIRSSFYRWVTFHIQWLLIIVDSSLI